MATWSVNPSSGVIGTGPSFTFPENKSSRAKNYIVTYSGDDGETCTKSITVEGTGQPVDCCQSNVYSVEILGVIPDTGVTSDSPEEGIAVIYVSDEDKTDCPINSVTFQCSTLNIRTTHKPSLDYEAELDILECDDNEDEYPKTHIVNVLIDGTVCPSLSFELAQEGKVYGCTCDSIESWIRTEKITFNNNEQDNQLIAYANTHGCGIVSATTSSEILKGGNVRCVYENNQSYVRVYADLLENTTGLQRTAGVKLYFKRFGETEYGECLDKEFTIIQGGHVASCNGIRLNNEYTYSWSFSTASGAYDLYAVKIDIQDGVNWIRHKPKDGRMDYTNGFRVYVDYDENDSENPRDCEITLTPYYDVIYNPDDKSWYGGIPCTPITKNIHQDATYGPACDCSLFDIDIPSVIEVETGDTYEYYDFNVTCNGVKQKVARNYSIRLTSSGGTLVKKVNTYKIDYSHGTVFFNMTFASATTYQITGYVNFEIYNNETDEVCKTFRLNFKKDGKEEIVCTTCEQFTNNIQGVINIDSEGGTFHSINGNGQGYCFDSVSYNFCDENGNDVSSYVYNWLTFYSYYKPAGLRYNASVNHSGEERIAYIKISPLDKNQTPYFDNCYKIIKLVQPPISACSCNNFGELSVNSSNKTSDTSRVRAGRRNVLVGEIKVYGKMHLDCVQLALSTTQSEYIRDIYFEKGEISYPADTGASVTFKVYCSIYDDSSTLPATGEKVTIDYSLKDGENICTTNPKSGYIDVYILPAQ